MKNLQKLAAVLMAVMVVLCGALLLTHEVSAASEGKISGTVKYEGTPPHMRGIDMSKDPYCVKANASTSPHKWKMSSSVRAAVWRMSFSISPKA